MSCSYHIRKDKKRKVYWRLLYFSSVDTAPLIEEFTKTIQTISLIKATQQHRKKSYVLLKQQPGKWTKQNIMKRASYNHIQSINFI